MPPAPVTSRTVFFLGAGFSRALEPGMLLLKDLAPTIRKRLREPFRSSPFLESLRPAGEGRGDTGSGTKSFEEWLSQLATPSPWDREEEIHQKRALFREIFTVLRELLSETAHLVDPLLPVSRPDAGTEDWRQRLIGAWSRLGSHVISLNYDTLVELAALGLLRERGLTESVLYPVEIPHLAARFSTTGAETNHDAPFRLYKLHGSINWVFFPDEEGDIVRQIHRLPVEPSQTRQAWFRRYSEFSVPFIVPPLTNKSSFYENPVLRRTWRKAADAIRQADHLVVIGFSFPPSDWLLGRFLDELPPGTPISIVDRAGRAIRNCRRLLPYRHDCIHQVTTGPDAVEAFAATLTPSPRQ